MDDHTIERLADLIVSFGANVQPGQVVVLQSDLGKEPLTRAIARRCYQRGAVYVDTHYFDLHLKRARILYAPDEALGDEPPWTVAQPREMAEKRGASISVSGTVDTDVLAGLDPDRLARDRFPAIKEWVEVSMGGALNWTVGPCATPDWAALVHPDADPDEALRLLSEQVVYACRLDEDDPVAAWRARADLLLAACRKMTDAQFDALHIGGPGTDLTVGLLPSSRWVGAEEETVHGLPWHANLPSEEVFTAPDPLRADGVVSATRPFVLEGTIVRDLVVRFEQGRAVSVEASAGVEAVRARIDRDDGGTRLGELALVDDAGRIGAMQTIFYDTLFDENAASHLALGNAYPVCVGDDADRPRLNSSEVHMDFMFGSPEVVVTGIRRDGGRVPVLDGGRWGF
ncbi:MAG: aminopeptidase [Gaiellales bacterium]